MRKNQKGFTLVELIIAVAILAIVTAAVCGFIVVGSRSYASSNTDIMLQQDAQLALNQMSDVIIDTTDSISYGLGPSVSGDMQLVLKDSEFAGEATEKCLIVVNKNEADSNNHNPNYWFYWSKDDEIIYFNALEADFSDMSPEDIRKEFENAEPDKAILAQHVTDFSIDISQFEANRVVMIAMTFENGNRTYSTSNNVTVRNRIALNEITVGPLRRAEDFVINRVPNVIVEPGEIIYLGDKVTVESSSGDTALKWEFESGEQNGTTISETSGQLNISLSETRETFNVRVSRLNEEYAGQNNRVARTIQVNVKRVTDVKINGPSSAKQGETISLTASAIDRIGLLKQSCDGHVGTPYAVDDTNVENWRLEPGSKAELVTNGDGSVSVKIDSSATVGSKIVVWADSTLSRVIGYGPLNAPTVSPVSGKWEITVTKGQESGARPLGSNLKYGSDNVTIFDYIRGDMPTKLGQYVFCVRVREDNDPNWHSPEDDWYIVYLTSGANMRFAPDLFGLDLLKSYHVYLQALIPMPKEIYDDDNARNGRTYNNATWWDSFDDIWKEYSTHLNDEGKYIGDLYYATDLFYETINPPVIQVKFENKTYPYEDKSYQEVISFLGGGKTGLNRPTLSMSETVNVETNVIGENNLRYTIYKEDEYGQWHRVFGPSYDSEETVTLRSGLEKIGNTGMKPQQNGQFSSPEQKEYNGTNSLGTHELQPWASTFLNYNNQNGDKSKAIGKYHIVPGFLYENNENIRSEEYRADRIIKQKTDNYWDTYYYKDWDCVMNFEITLGLTLRLSYEGQENSEEYINFPLPTDSTFPFGNTWDIYGQYYDVYSKSGEKLKSISGVHVACTYSNGEYTITLSSVETRGKVELTTAYGTYRWKPGYTVWECIDAGRGGAQITGSTWGPRIYFDYWGTPFMMELALPSDPSFPKDAITANANKYEINIQGNGIAYKESDTAGTGYDWINVWLLYEYDSSTKTYTVTLFEKAWDGTVSKLFGKWTCESNGTEWRKI